jgi:hypothetical protein
VADPRGTVKQAATAAAVELLLIELLSGDPGTVRER